MQNSAPDGLPSFFSPSGSINPGDALTAVRTDSHWVDAVTHVSLFVGRDIPDTRQQFEALLRLESDPAHRAVLYAGIARCLNSQMRLVRGAELLGQAWALLDDRSPDCRAFVLLEMVRFLVLAGNWDSARLLLGEVRRLTQSEYLLRLAEYYRLAGRASQGDTSVMTDLERSAEWFLQEGQKASVAAHWRMIAALRRMQGDEAGAEELYTRGLALCGNRELQFCLALLHNDLGLMRFQQDRPVEAHEHFDLALELAEYPYSRIDSLDLKGRCLRDEGRYREAVICLTDALNTALREGTMIIVPALCLYLGECHERLDESAQAGHFYQRAYQSAVELLEHGFPATATRLRAIREHVRFTGEHPVAAERALNPGSAPLGDGGVEQDYSFVLSHTLKEIRTIFQNALLDVTVQRFGTQRESVLRLGIAERTAGNVRRRFRELGTPDPPAAVVEFVSRNLDLGWKEMNRKFDGKVLAWLHAYYRGDRRRMSEELGLSYSHLSALVNRTRQKDADPAEEERQ